MPIMKDYSEDNQMVATTSEDQYLAKIQELESQLKEATNEKDRFFEWFQREKKKVQALDSLLKGAITLIE